MRILKNIIYSILLIIILLLLVFNIFSAIEKSFFGYRIFEVGSGSMEPILSVNDLIITKEENDYYENDIVTFKSGGSYITHRIVSIEGNEIITRGDNNNADDKSIKKEDIVGKYVYKVRVNRFIIYLFSEARFWLLLFLIGIVITVYLPDRYVMKKKTKERR